MAKRQSTMQMFFKKADRASATEYAAAEKNFFASDVISASGEDVLDQWFLNFFSRASLDIDHSCSRLT